MPDSRRLKIRLRLEDAAALFFFLVYLVLMAVFSGMRRVPLSPIDVLIIIPPVFFLLTKEIIHYFMGGEELRLESSQDVKVFIHPYWQIIRDFAPFMMILFMYYAMWGNATHMVVTHDRDADLIAWDQRLFGYQASVLMQKIISPSLTAWMEFAYFFHLPNIPLVACFIYIWRPRERFREMMTGLVVVSAFGLVGYLLVPGVGPEYSLHDRYTVPLTQQLVGVLNQESGFIDFVRVQRDVFPSLHVGISFVVWLYAWRNSRPLAWVLAPIIVSLWVSTLYLRYHYMVDVVAGLILAPLSYWLSNWMFKRFAEVDVPIWLPEGWAERIRALRAKPTPSAEPASQEAGEVQGK